MTSTKVVPIAAPKQSVTITTPRSNGDSVSLVPVVDPGDGSNFLFGTPLNLPVPPIAGTFDFFEWAVLAAGESGSFPDHSGAQGSYLVFLSPDSEPPIDPPVPVYVASVTQSGTALTLQAGPVLLPPPDTGNPFFFSSSQHPDGVAVMGILTGSPVLGDSYMRAIDSNCNVGPAVRIAIAADNEYLYHMTAFKGSPYGIAYINQLAAVSHKNTGRIVLYRVNNDLTISWDLDRIVPFSDSFGLVAPFPGPWVALKAENGDEQMVVNAVRGVIGGVIVVVRSGDTISPSGITFPDGAPFGTITAPIDATRFLTQDGPAYYRSEVAVGTLAVTSEFLGADFPGILAGPANPDYLVIVYEDDHTAPHVITFQRKNYALVDLGFDTTYDNGGSTTDFPGYLYHMDDGNMIMSRTGGIPRGPIVPAVAKSMHAVDMVARPIPTAKQTSR